MTQSNYEVHLFKIYHNGNVPKTMNNLGIPDVFDDKFYYIFWKEISYWFIL